MIPNLITAFRLTLVPILILLILYQQWGWAFALLAIAGISDGLDGFIARKFDMCSAFGAMLDPIADKILLVSLFITLALAKVIPAWLAIIIVARDMLIVAGLMISWLMARPMAVKPLFISRVNTAVQLVFIGLVLGSLAFALNPERLIALFAPLIMLLTLVTAGLYLMRWLRHIAR